MAQRISAGNEPAWRRADPRRKPTELGIPTMTELPKPCETRPVSLFRLWPIAYDAPWGGVGRYARPA
eukprot:2479743-Prymnesium_polylepis.1